MESVQDPYNWSERTFINCDLRYYNLASLGKFDAILIDPPWFVVEFCRLSLQQAC